MAIGSIGAATGPGSVQFSSIPTVDRRPLTSEELNSDAWVVDNSVNQPHWKQLEGVKDMFFKNIGASPKIGEDVREMDRAMDKLAGQFFDGEIGEDELAAGFEQLAEKFIATCKEKQYPFQALMGFDEAELSVAYDHFRASILKAAVSRNNAEGAGLASPNNKGWHYYNAGFYYKSESAIAAVSDKALGMAADKGFDRFEIPDYQALGKNSCYNFNSAVSGESDYIPGGLKLVEEKWIKDFDQVPPEGFKWFYEEPGFGDGEAFMVEGEEMPEEPKAKVWAMLNDMLVSADFSYSSGRSLPSDVKNLSDLLQFRPASRKEFTAANAFMKNFQVAPSNYFTSCARRESERLSQGRSWNITA